MLGSGGARGLAHIGVIGWLLDNGYIIARLSGASMGALVGGIHAAGKLDVYTRWVTALERRHVLRLLDPTIGRPGLFKGERVISVLRDMVGDRAIEDLPIAYTAVATDMATGEEVWLRQGPLFDAIRASMATPLVFTPARHGQRTLLDGALVNPVPVAPVAGHSQHLCVVVDLSGPAQARAPAPPAGAAAERRQGLIDVAFGSMQAMQDTIAQLRQSQHRHDVKIDIPRDACGFFEFWRAQELIDLGRERAAQAFARLAAAN